MSMRTYIDQGYGVRKIICGIEVEAAGREQKVYDFIRKYNPYFPEADKTPVTLKDLTDLAEGYEHDCGYQGLAPAFGEAITAAAAEKGIKLEYYQGDYPEEKIVVLPEGMPWQFAENEKALDLKGLEEIFVEILKEADFSGAETREDFGFHRAEMYG